jgi:hypothetical protein
MFVYGIAMDSTFIEKYCKIRLVSGSVVSGIFGIILLLVSLFASRIVGDTSSYILTDATVTGGDIKAYTSRSSSRRSSTYTTYFNVIYDVEYTVDNVKYKGKITERFSSFSQAKAVLDAAKGAIKRIYYDPLAHDKNSESKSAESVLRWWSFVMAVLLIGYAVVAFVLRDNQAMCAITTMGNIMR